MVLGVGSFGPDFLKYAYSEGFAKPNRFQVVFFPPSNITTDIASTLSSGRLLLGCRRAQWPSLSLATSDQRTKGPTYQIPFDQTFEELQLEFLSDRFHFNHAIFKDWIQLIYDPVTKRLDYYENYTTDLEIFQLDEAGIPVNRVKMENAYPKTLSQMDLAHDNNDEIQTFSVDFVYDNIIHGFEGLASDISEAIGF